MMMVGVKPVPDALGRVNKLEVMSLEELGRPRIDVVVNCSGVFRDLFVNQARDGRMLCARAGRGVSTACVLQRAPTSPTRAPPPPHHPCPRPHTSNHTHPRARR